jgi:uncharacterized protein YmfQ (DUF2313 family)
MSATDLLAGLQRDMPHGDIWPRDPDSVQAQCLLPLMQQFARLAARDNNLLIDAFPASTVEMLTDWENALGLPDPCAGISPSIETRRAQVVARFTAQGGQSINYLIAFAQTLGYTITITEFTPFRFGKTFGQPMLGTQWAYAWQVNAPSITENFFQFGAGSFGDQFATYGNTVLQCELARLCPAHTKLFFQYS